MRLILVRHGLTDLNLQRLTQSWSDHPLNDTGKLQAEQVGNRLRDESIDAAYTSDLTRARQTLDAILHHHPNLSSQPRPELRERSFGKLEGMPYDEVIEGIKRSGIPYHEFRPENGEALVEVRARLERFVEELRKRHGGQTVLIVSHGNAISVLLLHILRLPWSEIERFRRHGNTAVSEVVWDADGTPHLVRLKDDSHLNPELKLGS